MRDAYPFLQNHKTASMHGQSSYLMDTYDPYGYFPTFTESNPLTMIRNSVAEGLNVHLKLPNAIVVIAGTSLITQDELFLPSELEKKIRWIMKEILALLMTRKSHLLPKNFTFGEPRIIWIRAMQTHTGDPVPTEMITKFNNILHRICAGKAIYTPELELFTSSSTRCYDSHGRIIDNAFKELWWAVSDAIKQIDTRDEQYYITKKVEERLKELKNEGDLKFERKASTYLAVTDSQTFAQASLKARDTRDNHRNDNDRRGVYHNRRHYRDRSRSRSRHQSERRHHSNHHHHDR